VLTFLFIFALMLVMVYAADIQLSARDYNVLAAFAGAAVLMMLSYFLAGVLTGQFLEKWTGATALLCIWIVFSFIIPGIMQTIIHKSDNYKNNHYKIKSKKLDIVSKFEKESYKKEGNFDRDRLDIFKDLAEYYWNEKYIEIESLERNYYRNIESENRKKLGFMQLTPTTFYHVTAGEASSMGLMNSSDFHSYLIVKQKKFARFYIDRCFYHDPREMVSFIQGDENLFKSKSRLPPGYLENVIIHSCVCLILLLVSLGRFKKRLLANHDSNLTGKNKQDLEPKPGKLKVLLLNKTNFSKKAYDFYKKHYPGIHGKPAVSKNGSWFFVYLCHPDKLPGFIKVNVFIKFKMILMGLTNDMQRVILKKLNFKELKGKLMKNLSSSERGEILLTLLKGIKDRRPLFMLNDIAKDLPFEFTIKIKEWIEEMKEAGAFVVYLTTVPVTKDKRFQSDQDYEELPEWEKSVELIKNVINKTAIC
jgi:ABC-type transport system involved in multi-copper enzyme maturation permease subunit